MKLLSIGNSFSQDAQRYLHRIAAAAGESLKCVNLYIGGCSLRTHYFNILEKKINGNTRKHRDREAHFPICLRL